MKTVVTIGGGSGSPVVNEALLRTGKVHSINAIATTFDNGGSTLIRRLNSSGEIAYSDAMRILFSLIPPEHQDDIEVKTIKSWFLHRDNRNSVLGQEIINRRFDIKNGFKNIENDLKNLGVTLRGCVIPASGESGHIVFTTKTGAIYKGEQMLDQNSFSSDTVMKMHLEPKVKAHALAIKTIKEADLIILSCGSMYGSLLCNFLPIGMRTAMRESKAKVYLVTNLFSTRNETHDATPITLTNLVKKYCGKKVDGVIIPQLSREEFEIKYPKIADVYATRETSYFLGWDEKTLKETHKSGIKIIKHNAIKIVDVPQEGKTVVRHDPALLADALKQLI